MTTNEVDLEALRGTAPELPPCSTHPDAPHGFDRNGSHTADRYVCTCEGWQPPAPEPQGATSGAPVAWRWLNPPDEGSTEWVASRWLDFPDPNVSIVEARGRRIEYAYAAPQPADPVAGGAVYAPEIFPGTLDSLRRLGIDHAFCDTHGMAHSTELADADCVFDGGVVKHRTCKGANCVASPANKYKHSDECLFEHARAVASGVHRVSLGTAIDDNCSYIEWRGHRIELDAAIAALRQPVTLREVTMEDAKRVRSALNSYPDNIQAMRTVLQSLLPHGIPVTGSEGERG